MSLVLQSSGGGSVTIAEPTTASNFTQNLPAGTGTTVVNGVNGVLVNGTAVVSTSGTSIDFTGIPSWVKRVTVMFNQVSLSGTSGFLVQLGDAGGVETTGYTSTAINDSGATTTDSTAGFVLVNAGLSAATVWKGALYLSMLNPVTNAFIGTSTLTRSGGAQYASGVKSLSDVLDRVRITTINGTDTFDAGSINILFE
jgi:hypothetical protein